jgi:hypothetical protein
VTQRARTRIVVSRTALALIRCYVEVLAESMLMIAPSHESENGCARRAAQNTNAHVHAKCRSTSLVSMSSGCLQDVEVGDSWSANANEHSHAHDGCWPKVQMAEHRMKPYSSRYGRIRSSVEARFVSSTTLICFFGALRCCGRRLRWTGICNCDERSATVGGNLRKFEC